MFLKNGFCEGLVFCGEWFFCGETFEKVFPHPFKTFTTSFIAPSAEGKSNEFPIICSALGESRCAEQTLLYFKVSCADGRIAPASVLVPPPKTLTKSSFDSARSRSRSDTTLWCHSSPLAPLCDVCHRRTNFRERMGWWDPAARGSYCSVSVLNYKVE